MISTREKHILQNFDVMLLQSHVSVTESIFATCCLWDVSHRPSRCRMLPGIQSMSMCSAAWAMTSSSSFGILGNQVHPGVCHGCCGSLAMLSMLLHHVWLRFHVHICTFMSYIQLVSVHILTAPALHNLISKLSTLFVAHILPDMCLYCRFGTTA